MHDSYDAWCYIMTSSANQQPAYSTVWIWCGPFVRKGFQSHLVRLCAMERGSHDASQPSACYVVYFQLAALAAPSRPSVRLQQSAQAAEPNAPGAASQRDGTGATRWAATVREYRAAWGGAGTRLRARRRGETS